MTVSTLCCPKCKIPMTQHADRIFSFWCDSCMTTWEVKAVP